MKLPITKKSKVRRRWIITGGVVLVVAIAAAGIFLIRRNNITTLASGSLPAMEALVSNGTISTTIMGSGTLSNASSSNINIPVGIEIDEVYVSSGDEVAAGDLLATVSSASLSEALASVQEDIADLDSQINDAVSTSSSETITSGVDGRVKKIFVSAGDDVASAMLENKALMLVSLDGKMAVNIETSAAVSVDDSVNVTLSDGTVVTGTVISVSGTAVKITVTDNGTTYGDSVSVTDSDGNSLGSGTLYINQELKIVGTTGKVETIHTSENSQIYADGKLVTLSGDFSSSEYYSLVSQREALEDTLEALLNISVNKGIVAPEGGIITDVNVSAGSTTASESSQMTQNSSEAITLAYDSGVSLSINTMNLVSTSGNESEQKNVTPVAVLDPIAIIAPVTGETPQTVIVETDYYTGVIQWNPEVAAFNSGVVYSAEVTLTAKSGYCFDQNLSPTVTDALISGRTVSAETEGNVLTFTATFTATTDNQLQDDDTTTSNTDNGANTDNSNNGQAAGTGSETSGSTSSNSTLTASSGSTANLISDSTSSSSTASQDTISSAQSTSTSNMVTAFSISSAESMTMTLSVDELDILSISVGQNVQLTLDAISGTTFEGEITKVNKTGTSSGGVTKYSIEVTVAKDASMLSGMSASATVITEEKADILTIPANAVQEQGNRSFVYTLKDESGNLSGETEIETGITDGSQIEVVSGLSEGDTVYYQIIVSSSDTSTIDFSSFGNRSNFSGGSFSGDEIPSGGSMPSGGGTQ